MKAKRLSLGKARVLELAFELETVEVSSLG